MKMTEPKNVFIVILLVFSSIITIYSFSITAISPKKAGSVIENRLPVPESLNGTTEFYFVPAGDHRIWHVVNKYNPIGLSDSPSHNMSTYIFSGDSVNVVNEYAGIPNQPQWDLTLASYPKKTNNF